MLFLLRKVEDLTIIIGQCLGCLISGGATMVRPSQCAAHFPRRTYIDLHETSIGPPFRVSARSTPTGSLWALSTGLGALRTWTGRWVSHRIFLSHTRHVVVANLPALPSLSTPTLCHPHSLTSCIMCSPSRYISNRKSHDETKFDEPKDTPKFGPTHSAPPSASSHSLHLNPFTQSPDR